MYKIILRQLCSTFRQGLILILTFVLCLLGFIAVIKPLVDLKRENEAAKNKSNYGYYCFVCSDFNSLNLESIEKDLSTNKGEYLVVSQKEFYVEYLNFSGHGNAISLSESCLNDLQNTYGKNEFEYFKLQSGRIPKSSTEVLVMDFAYFEWNYDFSVEEKIKRAAVLPSLGECITTGCVTTKDSLSIPLELCSGFIVTNDAFNVISKDETINIFILIDRVLDSAEEGKLKSVVSKYAIIEDAQYIENQIDTSGNDSRLAMAVELSIPIIIAIVLGEIIILTDFLKSVFGFNDICSRLGLSKSGCCLLIQIPIIIYIFIAESVLFIILKLAEENDAINFLNIGHPTDLGILLFQFIIVLISAIYIFYRLKRKECR